LLFQFVDKNKLGYVSSNDSGVILNRDPDTVVGPDIAFYGIAKQPSLPEGYFEVPPDLAVVVLPPDDERANVRAKIKLYIEAGVRIVWVIDGETRTVTVYAGDLHGVEHDEADTLTAADILPGFSLPIEQIFAV